MITRIEIDGFKSFTDFSIDLEQFTMVAGTNGVGKSNLFDALLHVGRLVGRGAGIDGGTLRQAFESNRGSLEDLFTLYPSNERARTMTFAVELLLPSKIEDQFGSEVPLHHRRLRYEVAVSREDEGALRLERERLTPILKGDDRYLRLHKDLSAELRGSRGRRKPFIESDGGEVYLHQDGKQGRPRPAFALANTRKTALASISSIEFPHAYAVRRLLAGIRFLQLEPERLRQPSAFAAPEELEPSGIGLASAMARINRTDPELIAEISDRVAGVVPGIRSVEVVSDKKTDEWSVQVHHVDGHIIPARLVSDGTLRLLALAVLVHDPSVSGVVVVEEPENGIYAGRIGELLSLLSAFCDSDSSSRQLLSNTHSVPLVRAFSNRGDLRGLMYAYLKRVVRSKLPPHEATTVSQVYSGALQAKLFDPDEISRQKVALSQLNRLLSESAPPGVV